MARFHVAQHILSYLWQAGYTVKPRIFELRFLEMLANSKQIICTM